MASENATVGSGIAWGIRRKGGDKIGIGRDVIGAAVGRNAKNQTGNIAVGAEGSDVYQESDAEAAGQFEKLIQAMMAEVAKTRDAAHFEALAVAAKAKDAAAAGNKGGVLTAPKGAGAAALAWMLGFAEKLALKAVETAVKVSMTQPVPK